MCESPNVRLTDHESLEIQRFNSQPVNYGFDNEIYADWICDNCLVTGRIVGIITYPKLTLKNVRFDNNKTKHPEMQDDEVFVINGKISEPWHIPPKFMEYLRKGKQAYDSNGVPLGEEWYPVFGKLKPVKSK